MEENTTDLKLAINNLIWMHSPDELRLKDAEMIAIDIMSMIKSGKDMDGVRAERLAT